MLFELIFQSFGLKEKASGRRTGINMGGNMKDMLAVSEETFGLTRVGLSQE